MSRRKSKLNTTDYEPKRRNPITLGNDSNIDNDLKVIRVDSKNSILELSDNELKVRGTIDASAITVDGTSVVTDLTETVSLNDLSDVTYDSGDLTISSLDKIITSGDLELEVGGDVIFCASGDVNVTGSDLAIDNGKELYFDGGSDTYIKQTTSDQLDIYVGGVNMLRLDENGGGADDKIIILTGTPLYFDGGGDTYIHETSADELRITVGGDPMMQLSEKGADGNEVAFASCVGFIQLEPTYDDFATEVDFRHSNKQFVTFGSGNIGNIVLYFPLVSGNFQLLLKQDGTGSRTITTYKVYEFDETLADGSGTVKFAGGSNPTLTTDANHVDIISIYWDADNEIAYGVATLDFQF